MEFRKKHMEPSKNGEAVRSSILLPFEVDRASVLSGEPIPGAPQQTHKEIEKYLKGEKKIYDQYLSEPKLLILGSSDCGKSTLLKQMKILYGGAISCLILRFYFLILTMIGNFTRV